MDYMEGMDNMDEKRHQPSTALQQSIYLGPEDV